MMNISNVTVGMQCTDGTILVTGATGETDNSRAVTVTSTGWSMMPTPNDGRDYYVIEVGFGRSWKCNCTGCESNTATFSITEDNPC